MRDQTAPCEEAYGSNANGGDRDDRQDRRRRPDTQERVPPSRTIAAVPIFTEQIFGLVASHERRRVRRRREPAITDPRLLTVSAALVVFFVVARVSRCRLFDAAASVCTRIDGSSRHRQRRARRSRRRCSMCHVHEQGEGEKEGREQDRTAGGPFHALRHVDGVRDVVDGEGWLVKGVEGRREGQGMGKEVLRRSTKKPEG